TLGQAARAQTNDPLTLDGLLLTQGQPPPPILVPPGRTIPPLPISPLPQAATRPAAANPLALAQIAPQMIGDLISRGYVLPPRRRRATSGAGPSASRSSPAGP